MARILLTGASSFTGLWIAEALAAAGHEVTAPVRRGAGDYAGLRAQRLDRVRRSAELAYETPFGSPAFLGLIGGGRFDLLAHHAADIPGYRSPDYDPVAGMARNAEGARPVFHAFARAGGRAVIATGTAFEAGEGGEGPGVLAVSPYGLSKSLTNQAFQHYAAWEGLSFGKFVITNPFGRLEEGRMAWSLFQAWFSGRTGEVRTPAYVRDNIPAPLLAGAYARLADELLAGANDLTARPSGIVGTQGAFAERLAAEARARLGLPCLVEAWEQTAFPEPLSRVNSEPAAYAGWNEQAFWDDYLDYYAGLAGTGLLDAPA